MIGREVINGKIIIYQTTYYLYNNEEDIENDKPMLICSDISDCYKYCRNERKKNS